MANKKSPQVGILMGSASDAPVVRKCAEVLKEFGVMSEARVLSAHRSPKETVAYVESAKTRGIQVIVAAAGGAAHLAGVTAAHTDLPVIGIPIESASLKGLDSLLSTVQMPQGVPVACVAIGEAGAKNAAYLALRILALKDSGLAAELVRFRESMRKKIVETKLDF